MTSEMYVPFHRPSIGDEELRVVCETLRSGWLTTGEKTADLERSFCARHQAKHGVALSSGTAALHLALAGLDIGPGDEVITTPLTFCATVNAILHVGAKPVLADVLPDGNIDPDEIRRAITVRTKGVIPVHYGGLPCNMEAIWSIAAEHGLHVVEDAAHAAGAGYKGRPIGANGGGAESAAVAFSFYATKNITTGEGGFLTTPNPELAERVRSLSLHGIKKDAWKRYRKGGSWEYSVVECGFKYNLSDLNAALGVAQLGRIDELTEARLRIRRKYDEAFEGVPELETPPDRADCEHAWHLYVLRLSLEDLEGDRADFANDLLAAGVGISVHFIPIQMHPFYLEWSDGKPCCPRSEALFKRIISLPLFPGMTDDEIQHVIESVITIVAARRKRGMAQPLSSAARAAGQSTL